MPAILDVTDAVGEHHGVTGPAFSTKPQQLLAEPGGVAALCKRHECSSTRRQRHRARRHGRMALGSYVA